MMKNGIVDGPSLGHLASLLEPEEISRFWLNDDPNGICYENKLYCRKNTIQVDSLIFTESGKSLTLKSDVIKMMAD